MDYITNNNRLGRHYGLLEGDECIFNKEKVKVISFPYMDNNACKVVFLEGILKGQETKAVCEWCSVIIKSREDFINIMAYKFSQFIHSYGLKNNDLDYILKDFLNNETNYIGKISDDIRVPLEMYVQNKLREMKEIK